MRRTKNGYRNIENLPVPTPLKAIGMLLLSKHRIVNMDTKTLPLTYVKWNGIVKQKICGKIGGRHFRHVRLKRKHIQWI